MTTRNAGVVSIVSYRCWILFTCLNLAVLGQSTAPVPVYRWTTLAGRTSGGSEDGPAADARFNNPRSLAMDSAGNLFVADSGSHTIRKISSSGIVSTFAGSAGFVGSADGLGSAARFNGPQGVTVDAAGNVYVADTGNHTIRKITPTGIVTTFAGHAGRNGNVDGPTDTALFDTPEFLTADTSGNVYVGFRKISAGQVQTIQVPTQVTDLGGGTITVRPSGQPAVDSAGQLFFWGYAYENGALAAYSPARILKLDLAGNLTVLQRQNYSGFGAYQGSIFNNVTGNVCVTYNYLSNSGGQEAYTGNRILPDGTAAGTGINFVSALGVATTPLGCAVDQAGHWYYTRITDDAIIRDTEVYAGTPAGAADGTGPTARFESVHSLAVDSSANVWVAENPSKYFKYVSSPWTSETRLRRISPAGVVTTAFETGFKLYTPGYPAGLAADGMGNVYLAHDGQWPPGLEVFKISPQGTAISEGSSSSYSYYDLGSDLDGNLWAHFRMDGKIYRRPKDGAWTAVAGGGYAQSKDGIGEQARFGVLWSLTTDRQGNCFALDLVEEPSGLAKFCFIRKIKPDGTVTTVSPNLVQQSGAGSAPNPTFPGSMAIDSQGRIFITRSNSVVLLDSTGNETSVGGVANAAASLDGIGDKARFSAPASLTVDSQDNLYLFDQYVLVRKGEFLGYAPSIITQPRSVTVAAGNNAQFSVSASTPPAPNYQWYFDGNAITGATNNTLNLTNTRSADTGDYTVVVANSLGTVTSNKATLTVDVTTVPPPTSSSAGGGGGSIEAWFALVLLALFSARGWMKSPFSA